MDGMWWGWEVGQGGLRGGEGRGREGEGWGRGWGKGEMEGGVRSGRRGRRECEGRESVVGEVRCVFR